MIQDFSRIRTGLLEFGFTPDQITAKTEADFAQIDKIFRDAKAIVDANWRDGELETLAYVYFGGHGVTDGGMTHAVCGKFAANKPDQWTYKIEQKIRQLAKRKGAYVVALLDCGR